MQISSDSDQSRGHRNCASNRADIFKMDAHFKSFVLDHKADGDEVILKAAQARPKLVIRLPDDASRPRVFPVPNDKPRNQLDLS